MCEERASHLQTVWSGVGLMCLYETRLDSSRSGTGVGVGCREKQAIACQMAGTACLLQAGSTYGQGIG